ncbi:hypothetical protein F2Q70_00019044 [Brassica cretica]|uniref:Uncharacterized protein n=1 Tax=Brassica cretica TaxID=69181 RepID=A0A8S9I6L3_BRACR|nr:hypothetical protein F2Q70_00019044 [Brassica cretica]
MPKQLTGLVLFLDSMKHDPLAISLCFSTITSLHCPCICLLLLLSSPPAPPFTWLSSTNQEQFSIHHCSFSFANHLLLASATTLRSCVPVSVSEDTLCATVNSPAESTSPPALTSPPMSVNKEEIHDGYW